MSPALRRRLHEYALLTRLDRPIGILLLLWPALWALWIAAAGVPSPRLLLVFVLGTVLTRSAGCIVNDLLDRDIDPFVQRTRERPLAARRISPYGAIGLFVVLMLAALGLALLLDAATVRMAVVAALLMVSYPLFKRFFPAPQAWLGLAFGWAVPMAFVATQGEVPRVGWLLLLVTVVWACIYDTLYAMADREDDRRLGVRSTALLFGSMDLLAVGCLQAIMVFGLWLAGIQAGYGAAYLAGLAAAAALFAWQLWIARHRAPADCLRAFRANNYVGMAIFAGIAADHALRAA
ncbi:MAG: 4-hydroxybenzoate octaprenyltransferase [Gammaproteobacteria bacterium]|nr:4-hydroxybenzoate octaprenyltransferase [Gammaproteobacteria bacterium]